MSCALKNCNVAGMDAPLEEGLCLHAREMLWLRLGTHLWQQGADVSLLVLCWHLGVLHRGSVWVIQQHDSAHVGPGSPAGTHYGQPVWGSAYRYAEICSS
jgi:hypothetical protein